MMLKYEPWLKNNSINANWCFYPGVRHVEVTD